MTWMITLRMALMPDDDTDDDTEGVVTLPGPVAGYLVSGNLPEPEGPPAHLLLRLAAGYRGHKHLGRD